MRVPGLCLLLVLATAAVYGQVVDFDFISYDDGPYVTENPVVGNGLTLQGVQWAFTAFDEVNWHPLTWISHMIDVELFGLSGGAHHAVNAALHGLNTLLLFGLLLSLTGALWRSALVAALFSLHPLHVESVAWVSERKDVLSTAFGLLSIWTYVRYTRSGSVRALNASLVTMACSLMSKPTLVTLPMLLLLLDHWPLDRVRWPGRAPDGSDARRESPLDLVREKLPHFALAGLASLVTFAVQQRFGAMRPGEDVGLVPRLANAVVSYVRYLAKTVWPTDLAPLYPHPYIPGTGAEPWAVWQVAGAAVLLLGLSWCLLIALRRGWSQVGWLWFLGTAVPVIGVVQVGTQAMADRYTYVPLIGLFVVFAWGAAELAGRLARRGLPGNALVSGVCIVVVAALGTAAHAQVGHWRSSEALYTHALSVTPRNSIMLLGLATAVKQKGHKRRAVELYRRAIEIKPDYAAAHQSLAATLRDRREFDAATYHARKALEIEPKMVEAHLTLGEILVERNQIEQAIDHYRAAIVPGKWEADANNRLGNALVKLERFDEAAAHFRRALELRPDSAKSRYWLDQALKKKERKRRREARGASG